MFFTRTGNAVFTHNNGKLRHTTANTGTLVGDFTSAENCAFYDVEVSNGGGNISIDGYDVDIEHDTTGGSGNIKLYSNCVVTAGTDTRSCEWTNDTMLVMRYGSSSSYSGITSQE